MANNLCACPAPAALTTITDTLNCDIPGKIAKFIIQRNLASNDFPTIELEASWAGLPDAADDTKVVISPFVENFVFPDADLLKEGENFDGAENVVATAPQTLTTMIRNISNVQYASLRDLMCERDLAVYFIDDDNKFFVREVSSSVHNGFKISPQTFGVSDPAREGGKVDQFKCKVEFTLPGGWFVDAVKVAPEADFFPLSEIVPA